MEGSVTILLQKSKEVIEKEEEENASFSELLSPDSPSPINGKKIMKFTHATKTLQFLQSFNVNRKSTNNLNLTVDNPSIRASVSSKALSRNSMARDSMLKSPTKSKMMLFQNNLAVRPINEYLTLGDLENLEKFVENGRFNYIVSKVLKVGMAFGEMGGNNTLRGESVVCNEECHFVVMNKTDYREILMEIERIKAENDAAFLAQTFLKDAPFLSKENLLAFKYNFEKKKFNTGAVIYESGESPQECFLIKKGEVQVNNIFS